MHHNGLTTHLHTLYRHCSALRSLNHIGADGYHWRVCVEDKPVPGSSSSKTLFSWWDIQDEKASLPVKNASPSELQRLFTGSSHSSHSSAENGSSAPAATKAAKGAFKSLGKAMNAVAGAVDGSHEDHGPRVNVIAFKLLDLVKMHDDFVRIHGGSSRGGHAAPPPASKTESSSSSCSYSTSATSTGTHASATATRKNTSSCVCSTESSSTNCTENAAATTTHSSRKQI